MDTNFQDTRSRFDRIGGRYLFPKIAWGIIGLWIIFAGFIFLVEASEYHHISSLHESDLLTSIRINNVSHK